VTPKASLKNTDPYLLTTAKSFDSDGIAAPSFRAPPAALVSRAQGPSPPSAPLLYDAIQRTTTGEDVAGNLGHSPAQMTGGLEIPIIRHDLERRIAIRLTGHPQPGPRRFKSVMAPAPEPRPAWRSSGTQIIPCWAARIVKYSRVCSLSPLMACE
jgi:hypothetical protein